MTSRTGTPNTSQFDVVGNKEVAGLTLNLAAGDYFFRCEVHPSIMTGALIVQ